MMLAPSRPTAIAGVILNDIGPLIELPGIVRIKGYVGKLPTPRTFKEGAEILRWWFDAQFPKLAPQDWLAFAQRTWREHRGGLVPDYDLKLARTLKKANLERLPTLWNQFDALARVPLMVIRGANSEPRFVTEMEQHVQFGSFTSPPVARRGTRRSPAAWLSVLPCQPGRPGNNRPDCRVVPAGDRLCRRQADRDPDFQARSRAALDWSGEGQAGGAAMGVAIGRQLDRVAMEEGGGIAVYE